MPDDDKTVFDPLDGPEGAAARQSRRSYERYEIGELIGEGGMALIREAEDTHLGRRVAIKTMKPEVAANTEMRARFVQEGRIQAELAHPGTVPIHDAGELDKGEPFYAMEIVRGRTLGDILKSRDLANQYDRGELLGLVDNFERVCQTMAYAHGKGIIHRDIKPANIMVDKFGALAVMDWGLAKRLVHDGEEDPTHTRADVVIGTPGFMSPEQTRSLAGATEQTDVFALGVILYEILTFVRPFKGPSAAELTLDVLHHDPEPPRAINPACPRELSAICLKALAKDPRERYRDAGELAAELRRFREFRPVEAAPPRWIDHLANWGRRNRALAGALGALLFVAILVGTAVGYGHFQRARTVDRITGQIEELQTTLREQQGRLAELVQREGAADPAEIARLDGELANTLLSLRGYTWALVGFTYPRSSPETLELARRSTLEFNDALLEMGRYALLAAHVRDLLARIEENDNYVGYTSEQIDRLRRQRVEAEARLGR